MKMHHCHYLHVNDKLERQNMYFKITPTFVIMAVYCMITIHIMIKITEHTMWGKSKGIILKRHQNIMKQRGGEKK